LFAAITEPADLDRYRLGCGIKLTEPFEVVLFVAFYNAVAHYPIFKGFQKVTGSPALLNAYRRSG